MRGLIELNVYVKNIGEDTIELPEIQTEDGEFYPLQPGEEIDMTEERPPYGHYKDAQSVLRCFKELKDTVLYQEHAAGNLEYRVESRAQG